MTVKKIGSYLAAGFAAQGAAAVSGLLLARVMTVGDYALYTVALAIIGAVNNLTRGGVQMGFAAVLGRVWPNMDEASRALSSARRVRLLVSALTMPPILAFAWYLLSKAGGSPLVIMAVITIIAALWYADLHASILDQLLYFAKKAEQVQFVDGIIAWLRLVMVGFFALTHTIALIPALLTNFFTVAGRVPMIQKWVHAMVGRKYAPADPEMTRSIRKIALRQIPVDVWGVAQTQITLFFLARGAPPLEMATYGALGRIAQILTPFSAMSIAYFVPAFATAQRGVLWKILRYTALVSVPGLGLLGIAILEPRWLLIIIGPAYLEQETALVASATIIVILNAVQVAWSLISHRGWNQWGWLRIPIGIVWCFVGPLILPVNTAAGAYLFFCGFAIGTVTALGVDLVSARRQRQIETLL